MLGFYLVYVDGIREWIVFLGCIEKGSLGLTGHASSVFQGNSIFLIAHGKMRYNIKLCAVVSRGWNIMCQFSPANRMGLPFTSLASFTLLTKKL